MSINVNRTKRLLKKKKKNSVGLSAFVDMKLNAVKCLKGLSKKRLNNW